MKQEANKKQTISRLSAVGASLLGFGIVFDQVTNRINKRYEQKSAFLVVIGVGATVIGRQLLPAGLFYDFFAFACSGAPMIAGQQIRQRIREERAQAHERELHVGQTQTLANARPRR